MVQQRKWWALAVLVLPMVLISVDMTVMGFTLPFLSADLSPSGAEQLWIVDIYSFIVAGLLVLMGTIGDRIGRRKLLINGAIIFCVASILAAFSSSAEMLIAARALQGVGGATLLPATLSMISTIFQDPHQRRIALAIWGTGFSAGMTLGPVIGGWLLEYFWWGSVFLINVPILILFLVAAPFLLPEVKDPQRRRFDWLSAALLLAMMLPIVYGIKLFAQDGLRLDAVLSFVAGLLVGVWFLRRQSTLPEPMLDLALFKIRAFSVSVATNFLAMFPVMILLFLIPQYLQSVLGLRSGTAALWMLPVTFAGALGGLLAPAFAKRMNIPKVMGRSALVSALGIVVFTQLGAQSGLILFLIGAVVMNVSLGLTQTLANDLLLSSVPKHQTSAAASISETGYELGGALGTAIMGSIVTAIYRTNLTPDAPEEARKTLSGAIHAAEQLPDPQSQNLVTSARDAFMHGFDIAAWVGFALLVYIGVQILVVLRSRPKLPISNR